MTYSTRSAREAKTRLSKIRTIAMTYEGNPPNVQSLDAVHGLDTIDDALAQCAVVHVESSSGVDLAMMQDDDAT